MAAKFTYFPNLDSLRFFAAFAIIIVHCEQLLNSFHPGGLTGAYLDQTGILAISFFFGLSGFLITYLLLKEKDKYKTISIKKFYIRRILRIWPLYFLITFLTFFVVNQLDYFHIPKWSDSFHYFFWEKLLLYIFMFPNLVNTFFIAVPYASHLWTIGVEEQFYLTIPLFIKLSKHLPWLLFGLLLLYGGLRAFQVYIESTKIFSPYMTISYARFLEHFNFYAIVFGSYAAYFLFYEKTRILNILFSKPVQILSYVGIFGILFGGIVFPGYMIIMSVLFSIVILNMAANPKTLFNIKVKFLDYLGRISYGIYLYHILMIVLAIKISMHLGLESRMFIYPMAFFLTITTAHLSFKYFEGSFLKMRKKFST